MAGSKLTNEDAVSSIFSIGEARQTVPGGERMEWDLFDGKIFSFSHTVLDKNIGGEYAITKSRISCVIH